jgi:hypothetical protein
VRYVVQWKQVMRARIIRLNSSAGWGHTATRCATLVVLESTLDFDQVSTLHQLHRQFPLLTMPDVPNSGSSAAAKAARYYVKALNKLEDQFQLLRDSAAANSIDSPTGVLLQAGREFSRLRSQIEALALQIDCE